MGGVAVVGGGAGWEERGIREVYCVSYQTVRYFEIVGGEGGRSAGGAQAERRRSACGAQAGVGPVRCAGGGRSCAGSEEY
jgi:hypothetical protein